MEFQEKFIKAKLIAPSNLISGSKDGTFSIDLNLNFETNSKIIKFTPSEILQCKFLKTSSPDKLRVQFRCNTNFETPDTEFEFASSDLNELRRMLENYGVLFFDETSLKNEKTFESNSHKIYSSTGFIKDSAGSEKSSTGNKTYSDIRNPNLTCTVCFNKPAGPIRLNSTAGRVIWSTTRKLDTNLCAQCAELAYIEQQKINLTEGWWAPRSAFLTIIYLIKNIFNIATHRREINKITVGGVEIPRPRLNIRTDGKTILIGTVSVAIIAFLVDVFANNDSGYSSNNSKIGSCWHETSGEQLEKVDCSSDSADYKVTTIVDDFNKCPYQYYMKYSSVEFGCLSSY